MASHPPLPHPKPQPPLQRAGQGSGANNEEEEEEEEAVSEIEDDEGGDEAMREEEAVNVHRGKAVHKQGPRGEVKQRAPRNTHQRTENSDTRVCTGTSKAASAGSRACPYCG
mmetsp:Transcript_29216/g.83930  ORF Transcript_29216/g.83930 Transcript_29216/m.83930 type:complete len:112 (-) Transcript_29216:628-963(-)